MSHGELEKSNRSYEFAAAIAVGLGTTIALGFIYLCVGMFSGVIGVHVAPSPSSKAYFYCSAMLPVLGVAAGLVAFRRFRKKTSLNGK